jgi:peptide/nickel transport system permease protein
VAAYLIRRIGYSIVLLVLVSFVGFLIIDLPPGDFLSIKIAQLEARGDRSAAQQIDALKVRYGLDKPILERYWIWATNFVRGDFGESFKYERPVSSLISERLALTVVLSLTALIVTWAIAIPLGVYAATHQYSKTDQLIGTLAFLGLGVPDFLLALVVLFVAAFVFNVDIGGLFSREYVDAPWSLGKAFDLLKHLWLPAIIIGVTHTAGLMRIMRGNLLDVLGMPFVQAARARGLAEGTVIRKHAVRVAINPLITILGTSLPALIGGEALVSIVMNLPTMGPLFVEALQSQDSFMAGTSIVFFTFLLLAGNLLADILLAVVDPRIAYN